jgi:hypothetical protein
MSLGLSRLCKPRVSVFSKFLPFSSRCLLGWVALVLSFSLSLNSTPAWAQDKAPDKTEKKDEAEIPI